MRLAGTFGLILAAGFFTPCWAGTVDLTPEFRQQAQQACAGDALRLCPQSLFDEEQTAACMKRYRADLTPGCRTVYDEGIRTQRRR